MGSAISSQFDFTILDETEDYIVVNKPAPLQIHPSKPQDHGLTLWDGLRELLSYELVNGGQVSIVNRLDRETSGLVLIAKNSAAARRFGKAMMRRQVQKSYLAMVHGHPEWNEITVEQPILRAGEVMESAIWVKQIVHEQGVPCESHFEVLQRWEREGESYALIEAEPHTGRMHQLRVHLSYLGHPVVGDKIYGTDETCYLDFIETGWTESMAQRLLLPRQALHSHRMELSDGDEVLSWEAPLTPDLALLLPGSVA
jgi:23S rRNA pseudouridine1911/1915/1917 synthase